MKGEIYMRKRMKRKMKMRKWLRILVSVFLIIIGIQLYYDLSLLGSQQNSLFDEMILILGWIWLLFGQIGILYLLWEN